MIPKYVYHYTSIDSLKKIIESKKIRFKRLDLLNDPYEGLHEFENLDNYSGELRKVIYCSWWTDSVSVLFCFEYIEGETKWLNYGKG